MDAQRTTAEAARAKIDRLVKRYQSGGLLEIAERLTSYGYLPAWLLSFSGIDVFELARFNEAAVRRKIPDYRIRYATPKDIAAIVAITDTPPPGLRVLLERFFLEGHRAYLVSRGDEPVAYAWTFRRRYEITLDDYGERTMEVTLADDMRFFGNGVIARAYRMRGIFPHLIQHAIEAEPPGTRFFTSINHLNEPSRLAHLRLGFEPASHMVSLRLAGIGPVWRVTPTHGKPRLIREGSLPLSALLR